MSTMLSHKRDWDELGRLDPLWAVLSDPAKRYGRWDPTEFFRTGQDEISALMREAGPLGYPTRNRRSLDFGCGVGRLTAALADYFQESVGVDVSESMISRARESHPQCRFVLNDQADLKVFPDGYFDFIYSAIVLQHLPTENVIAAYIRDFLRTLAPGGLLVFQVPSYIPPYNRIQGRRRVYALLHLLGCSPESLLRLGLNPMRITAIPVQRVRALIGENGCRFIAANPDHRTGYAIQSYTYWVTQPEG